jgi:hypothetical protein
MSNKSIIRLLGAAVLLVLVLAGYGFWYAIVSTESEQAGVLSAKIAEQNNAATKSAQAKSELTLLTSQGATIDQYFVQTNNLVPFLEQLQSLGKFLGSNVQVASVSAEPGSPYGQLNLSLGITGSFDAVVRAIGAIEYEPYNVSISSLSLNTSPNPDPNASTSPQWNVAAVFVIGAQTGATTSAAIIKTPLLAPTTATTTGTTTATTTLKTS